MVKPYTLANAQHDRAGLAFRTTRVTSAYLTEKASIYLFFFETITMTLCDYKCNLFTFCDMNAHTSYPRPMWYSLHFIYKNTMHCLNIDMRWYSLKLLSTNSMAPRTRVVLTDLKSSSLLFSYFYSDGQMLRGQLHLYTIYVSSLQK